MRLTALITAGGNGNRFSDRINKLFVNIEGRPVIIRTIENLVSCKAVSAVIVALKPHLQPLALTLCTSYGISLPVKFTDGGDTRQESIMNMLEMIDDTGFVAVHDCARPLTSKEDMEKIFSVYQDYPEGIILASKSTDTLKEVEHSSITKTVDRSKIYNAQTPQIFKTSILKEAYQAAQKEGFKGTDDASLVERIGRKVYICEACKPNPKITYLHDIIFCEALLNESGRCK